MYRNCVYNNREKCIHLFTWDEHGNRVKYDLDYSPYLFLDDKMGPHKSIFGTNLKKREFQTLWERNKFVKDGNFKRTFENLPPYQQFLIDTYWMDCDNEDFSKYQLKTLIIDIECPSNDKFPDPELAEVPINLVTIYDTIRKEYNTFGLGLFDASKITDKVVKYHPCKSEEILLKSVVGFISNDYPDIISGWNSNGFDIPYLINRVANILDESWTAEFSPIGRYYEKINKNGKFGQPEKTYVIDGISCLDYMIMYKKFAMEKQESYRLDHIAEQELDIRKIEYDGTLWDLAKNDWKTYVEYNIRDVELLVKLDDKLRYIELIRFIAYTGLCGFEKAIDTLPVVNGSIAVRARHRDEHIPTFIRPHRIGKNAGGFVAKPKTGISESIVSFDANSLYPSVMITLNLSPETKVGTFETVGDIIKLNHVSGRQLEYTKENFSKLLVAKKLAISKSKCLFSQEKKGIIPEFLDGLYTKRKDMKKKMFEVKKYLKENADKLSKEEISKLEFDIQRYDTFQYAYKINLNSVYGYMGNPYAPMGDDDIANAVTLTGQAVIKKSNSMVSEYFKREYPQLSNQDILDFYIYGDTDSFYLTLKSLEKVGIFLKDGEKISDKFYDICNKIENEINSDMKVWAAKNFKSLDPRFIFKRESICDNGIFVAGKNYVLHLLDSEGIQTDEYKYKGVEVVKTTMPRAIKPFVKQIIESIITDKSLKTANEYFGMAYEEFKKLEPVQIAKIQNMNNYEKHSNISTELNTAKGMTGHVKAAYYYNYMLDKLGIAGKYDKLRSGDKVKQLVLKQPNKYRLDRMGFKDKYPEEFNDIFKIDYDTVFVKVLYTPIKVFYDCVGWVLRKPNENVRVELEDIFGE